MRSWFLVLIALTACSRPHHRAKGRSLAIGKLATEPVPPNPPWPIETAALLEPFQGAWVMRDEQTLGSIAAWDIHGDHVTIWDAKTQKETTATLVFDSPCEYQLHFENGYTRGRFVFDGTTLHAGLGDAGAKHGDQWIACTEIGGVIASSTTCTFNYQYEDVWMRSSATCTLSSDALKIHIPRADYDPDLAVHGDLLADDQLWSNTPLHAASYPDAKAKAKTLVTPE